MGANGGVKVKADEIVGLRELISDVILRERDKLIPVALLQDVEEVRRSPAGAVIRMEGKIDRLEEEMVALRAEMATKEDVAALRAEMATKEDVAALRAEMATKVGLVTFREGLAALRAEMATKVDLVTFREGLAALRAEVKEDVTALRAEVKEDVTALRAEMVTKGELASLAKAMETRFEEQGKRIDLLQRVFFAFLALLTGLQVAILVKLFL